MKWAHVDSCPPPDTPVLLGAYDHGEWTVWQAWVERGSAPKPKQDHECNYYCECDGNYEIAPTHWTLLTEPV